MLSRFSLKYEKTSLNKGALIDLKSQISKTENLIEFSF